MSDTSSTTSDSTPTVEWDVSTHGPAPEGAGYDVVGTPVTVETETATGNAQPDVNPLTGDPAGQPDGGDDQGGAHSAYDPSGASVPQVLEYLASGGPDGGLVSDDERARVLDAERAGQNRKGVTGDS